MIPFRIVVGSSMVGCDAPVRKTARRTEPFALKDFVTAKNTLPGGSIERYARCFGACLAERDVAHEDKENDNGKRKAKTPDVDANNKSKGHGRLLSAPREDGTRTLTLWLDVGCHAYHAKAEYCFTLLPIQNEFVDVIAAKMVDVEEEVVEIRDVKRLKTMTVVPPREDLAVLALVGFKETRQNYCIKWTEDVSGGEAFALVDNGQTIVFKTGRIFYITLDVLHSSTSKGFQLELLQNDEMVSWVTGCQTSHGVQSFLPLARKIKSGDTLKVLYIGNNRTNTGNTMSIIQPRKE